MKETDLIKARLAVDYARKHISLSSTSLDTPSEKVRQIHSIIHLNIRGQFSDQECLQNLFRATDMFVSNEIHSLKHSVKTTKRSKVGNCHEYAALVLNQLRKLGVTQAENIVSYKGDHSFVVVNRRPDSNINDYTTWGPDAFVIDAWALRNEDESLPPEQKYQDAIFDADQVPQKLKCFQHTSGRNIVFPYNPEQHDLSVLRTLTPNHDETKNLIFCSCIQKLYVLKSTALMLFEDDANRFKFIDEIDFKIAQLRAQQSSLTEEAVTNITLDQQLTKIILYFLQKSLTLAKLNNVSQKHQETLVQALVYPLKTSTIAQAIRYYSNDFLAHILDYVSNETFHQVLCKESFGRVKVDAHVDAIEFATMFRDENFFKIMATKFDDRTVAHLFSRQQSKRVIQRMIRYANHLVARVFDVDFFKKLNISENNNTLALILSESSPDSIIAIFDSIPTSKLNQLMAAKRHYFLATLAADTRHEPLLHNIIPRLDYNNLLMLSTLLVKSSNCELEYVSFFRTSLQIIAKSPQLKENYGILFRQINSQLNGRLAKVVEIEHHFGRMPSVDYYNGLRLRIQMELEKHAKPQFRLFGYSSI